MSFSTRLKKLTDYVYSPTNPASEDAIREQIDDSIQEVYSNTQSALTSKTLGDAGSNLVGHNSASITADNVGDALEENRTAITDIVLGEIPDNTLTELKMAAEMKKQSGGVAKFDDLGDISALDTTNKDSAVVAINEVNENTNIIRASKLSTGTANAITLDTLGEFDRTLDGNILPFTPSLTNTGAVTISEDSQTAKAVKKFNIDTDAFVDVDAGDIKKNTPTSLTWSVSDDFFIYAPKGGANPMEEWDNPTSSYSAPQAATLALRTSVVGSGWIIAICNPTFQTPKFRLVVDGSDQIGDASNGAPHQAFNHIMAMIRFETGFSYYDDILNTMQIYYVLGDDFEIAIPKTVASGNIKVTTNSLINVTGKGWLYGGFAGNNGATIEIDSVDVGPNRDTPTFATMFKFENSLNFKHQYAVGTSGVTLNYTLLP